MSWSLFVIIQTAIFSIAVIAALWLHLGRQRRHNDELTRLCLAAHDQLASVTGKLKDIQTTAPPEKMLEQRMKALSGEDPITQVRRLVLENEIRPVSDFEQRLMAHLAVEEPDEQEFVTRWKSVRAECQQLAMFLVADNPSAYEAITQLFEVIEPLDQLYDVKLEPLTAPGELPAEATASADTDLSDASDGAADSAGDELDQDELDALLASAQSEAGGDPAEGSRRET